MPIRLRLGLWYGGIAAMILIVFAISLYVSLASHLEGMVEDSIAERAAHIVAEVELFDQKQAVPVLEVPELAPFGGDDTFIQVVDGERRIAARSLNLGSDTLPLPVDSSPDTYSDVSLNGTTLRLLSVPVVSDGQSVGWVQVASTFRQRDTVLNRVAWILGLGGSAAVALVGLVGFVLAGRALRPVADMTDTARAIALSRGFSRRVEPGDSRDELGQLAQTFNEMLASLEEAYAIQQRFTADASHELRAPLTAIRGNLDLLDRAQDMSAEDRAAAIGQVKGEVGRLVRLVNDLLGLARADAGQNLRREEVELDSVLMEVRGDLLGISDGVSVNVGGLEPVIVEGDPDRLRELLLALGDNAIKYTPEGGSVTFELMVEPPWVTVTVDDTGIGIDPGDADHVFERFWRADRARSRDRGGTGLGLSIAKWIVDQHGGEIRLSPRENGGTRATVRLLATH